MKKHQYGRYEVRAFARPVEGTSPVQYTAHVQVFDASAPSSGPITQNDVESSEPFSTPDAAEATGHSLAWLVHVKARQKYTKGPVPNYVFVIDNFEGSSVSYEATQTYPHHFPQAKIPVPTLNRSNKEIADHLAKIRNLIIDVDKYETEILGEGRYVRFYRSSEGTVVAVEDGERTVAVLRTFIG